MKELSKAQLKFLRKESHSIKPLFQLGKLGLSDNFIQQFDSALEKRELIKFNILQNSDEDLEESAQAIAETLEAVLVQTIGNIAVLYRQSQDQKNQDISTKLRKI